MIAHGGHLLEQEWWQSGQDIGIRTSTSRAFFFVLSLVLFREMQAIPAIFPQKNELSPEKRAFKSPCVTTTEPALPFSCQGPLAIGQSLADTYPYMSNRQNVR